MPGSRAPTCSCWADSVAAQRRPLAPSRCSAPNEQKRVLALVLLLIFLASAGVSWAAGVNLSDYTGALAERLHVDAALGGVILLAVATNLPEIAIAISAALSGHVEVAVGTCSAASRAQPPLNPDLLG